MSQRRIIITVETRDDCSDLLENMLGDILADYNDEVTPMYGVKVTGTEVQ